MSDTTRDSAYTFVMLLAVSVEALIAQRGPKPRPRPVPPPDGDMLPGDDPTPD